jgi:hypothetical protein
VHFLLRRSASLLLIALVTGLTTLAMTRAARAQIGAGIT